MGKFLEAFGPLMRVMPEVPKPDRRVSLREKIFWTALVLTAYLLMCQVPLYGAEAGGRYEPLMIQRVIFASRRGTLVELGIGPIVTAGLIMQLLAGSKLISIDFADPRDRAHFTGAQKVLAVFMTIAQACMYILGGMYGALPSHLAIYMILQLVAAGIIILLLDELVQKGWGLGSGVSLFILAGVAEQVVWQSLAPYGPLADKKYLGALIAFAQTFMMGESLWNAFYRPHNYPTMTGFIAMIAVLLLVIYLEGMRVEVPAAYSKYRGMRVRIPLKFLYASNVPVILASALFANVFFFTQIIWTRLSGSPEYSFLLSLLGRFKSTEYGLEPIGGLVYYLTPPRGLEEALKDPIHTTLYISLLTILCVFFSIIWVESSGISAKDQAQQLVQSGLHIPGFRQSPKIIEQMLSRYIPIITILGGLAVGFIAAFADVLGALGSGMGILLSVGILNQYYQMLVQERMFELYPAIGKFLGERK